MTIFQVMGKYQSDRPRGLEFTSHVWTDKTVYGDRLSAEMTVDLLTLLMNDTYDCHEAWNLGLHGDDTLTEFYVEEFTV